MTGLSKSLFLWKSSPETASVSVPFVPCWRLRQLSSPRDWERSCLCLAGKALLPEISDGFTTQTVLLQPYSWLFETTCRCLLRCLALPHPSQGALPRAHLASPYPSAWWTSYFQVTSSINWCLLVTLGKVADKPSLPLDAILGGCCGQDNQSGARRWQRGEGKVVSGGISTSDMLTFPK